MKFDIRKNGNPGIAAGTSNRRRHRCGIAGSRVLDAGGKVIPSGTFSFAGILKMCFGTALVMALAAPNLPALAAGNTSPTPSAAERMAEPGPQEQKLARMTGTWNVTSTLRLTPDATPIVTTGIVAERGMIGPYLQEVMKPAPGSKTPDFRRICYLTYFRVEGRWQYVSVDTRFPVGIMPAVSFEKEKNGKLTLEFAPLAFVGLGQQVEGRLIHSNLVITQNDDDHETVQQYWAQADGTGRQWLAVQYDYSRRH